MVDAAALYNLLFESAPDLYLVLDPDLNIVAVSNAYLRATHVKRQAILGRGVFDVFPDNPNDLSANGVSNLRASLTRALQTKTADTMAVQKYDIRVPGEHGEEFEVRYWSPVNTPVMDSSNTVRFIIHRVEDVTEFVQLKQMGVEQTKLAEALRTRTGEMEVEIYQRAQEIQATNKMLRLANNELDAFNRMVSHDLRNPVEVIKGFSDLLLENSNLGVVEKDYVTEINASAKKMDSLINDLLALAQASRYEIHVRPVNLSEMVKSLAKELHKRHPEREVDFLIQEGLSVMGDRNLLHIAFDNLLNNAWKFTTKTPRARIEFAQVATGEPIYYIKDNGAGFPQDEAGKLFAPFSRLHVESEFPGTGIGLTTVKRIIDRHGGRVWAESKEMLGATFFVAFA